VKEIALGPRSRTPTVLLQTACRVFGRWPGVALEIKAAAQRAKVVASLGFAPRPPVSETGVLLLHYKALLRRAVINPAHGSKKIGMARQLE
jgi:hypothetical protein